MVELVLSTADEDLLPHCYVAMRVGDSQKIGRLSTERMYKFPENAVGEHKYAMLDVFQRVGGCTVSIKSKDGDQDLQVATKAGNLNLRVSKPGYKEKAGTRPQQVEDAPLLKPKFEVAKAYLAKHNLEERLKEAMKAVINDLPDDPVGFINNKLRETDESDIIRVPPPPEKEKDPAVALQESARREIQEALTKAAEDGSFDAAAKERMAEKQAEKLQSMKADAGGSADMRQAVRQAFLKASLDGTLPDAFSEAARPFPLYYTNNFRGSKFVQSFAAQLFKTTELVEPPSSMIREQAEEFRAQIKEFEKDLSQEGILECKKAFSQCENPADGTMKLGRLPQALLQLGHALTAKELKSLMAELGADENGSITFPEFLSIVVERREEEADAQDREEMTQDMIRTFKMFDRAGTGFVRCADLRSVMTGLGDSFSQDEVEHMISEAGSKNGQINYVEFAHRMAATAT